MKLSKDRTGIYLLLRNTWKSFFLLLLQEKRRSPMNSDVAAFATRAKVVYPINQKYRVSVPQEHCMHTYITLHA